MNSRPEMDDLKRKMIKWVDTKMFLTSMLENAHGEDDIEGIRKKIFDLNTKIDKGLNSLRLMGM